MNVKREGACIHVNIIITIQNPLRCKSLLESIEPECQSDLDGRVDRVRVDHAPHTAHFESTKVSERKKEVANAG